MTPRSECRCPCHQPGTMMYHNVPCCDGLMHPVIPAFPSGMLPPLFPIMSKRDWFAGQALSGSLAGTAGCEWGISPTDAARAAVDYADALLAALQEPRDD